eukprot:gene11991-22953_t
MSRETTAAARTPPAPLFSPPAPPPGASLSLDAAWGGGVSGPPTPNPAARRPPLAGEAPHAKHLASGATPPRHRTREWAADAPSFSSWAATTLASSPTRAARGASASASASASRARDRPARRDRGWEHGADGPPPLDSIDDPGGEGARASLDSAAHAHLANVVRRLLTDAAEQHAADHRAPEPLGGVGGAPLALLQQAARRGLQQCSPRRYPDRATKCLRGRVDDPLCLAAACRAVATAVRDRVSDMPDVVVDAMLRDPAEAVRAAFDQLAAEFADTARRRFAALRSVGGGSGGPFLVQGAFLAAEVTDWMCTAFAATDDAAAAATPSPDTCINRRGCRRAARSCPHRWLDVLRKRRVIERAAEVA